MSEFMYELCYQYLDDLVEFISLLKIRLVQMNSRTFDIVRIFFMETSILHYICFRLGIIIIPRPKYWRNYNYELINKSAEESERALFRTFTI